MRYSRLVDPLTTAATTLDIIVTMVALATLVTLATLKFIVTTEAADIQTPPKKTETCFSASETVDGLNKICFYDCVSGQAAITIKATQLCPLTIKR